MARRATAAVLTLALLFAPTAAATPVFDCTKPEVRRAYPAQCPQLSDPLLTGGHGGGGGQCGGLCGILHRVLGGLL